MHFRQALDCTIRLPSAPKSPYLFTMGHYDTTQGQEAHGVHGLTHRSGWWTDQDRHHSERVKTKQREFVNPRPNSEMLRAGEAAISRGRVPSVTEQS